MIWCDIDYLYMYMHAQEKISKASNCLDYDVIQSSFLFA